MHYFYLDLIALAFSVFYIMCDLSVVLCDVVVYRAHAVAMPIMTLVAISGFKQQANDVMI